MSQSRKSLSTGALVAIAIAMGAVVGAAGIYWKASPSGNAPTNESLASADGAVCKADAEALASLKLLAKGEVAAMAVRDEPIGLPNKVMH